MSDEVKDVIVIGGGPSGFTAAIYLARAKLSTLVLAGEMTGGQLMLTTEVENYPGFPTGVNGVELVMGIQEQAKKFGAEIRSENVTKVKLDGEVKSVWVGDNEYKSKAVIISTGANAKMLGIGEEKLMGKGVSTCAVCDAAFYKDKTTYVVGGGDAAMEDALALAKFAGEVTMVHRKSEFRASKIMQDRVKNNAKIKFKWNCEVVEILGETVLKSLKIRDVSTQTTEEVPADGLFLAIGHYPATEMFKDMLRLNEKGFLLTAMTALLSGTDWKVEEQNVLLEGYPTETSVKGVFGAGDVVDFRYKQAITAAAMGCQAALDVEKYLTGNVSSW